MSQNQSENPKEKPPESISYEKFLELSHDPRAIDMRGLEPATVLSPIILFFIPKDVFDNLPEDQKFAAKFKIGQGQRSWQILSQDDDTSIGQPEMIIINGKAAWDIRAQFAAIGGFAGLNKYLEMILPSENTQSMGSTSESKESLQS